MTEETTQKICRLAEINQEMDELKQEKDTLDVYFQRLAEDDLKDSKRKTAVYTADGCKVVATLAKKVSLQYPNLVMRVFRDLTEDVIKTEKKQTLSAGGKRLLGGICAGEYVQQTIEEVIGQIAQPEHVSILKKKLRGKNYEGDIKNLMAVTGCSHKQAAEDAYLIAEAAVWQEFVSIMAVNDIPPDRWEEMLNNIKTGIIVEESPKIQVEVG